LCPLTHTIERIEGAILELRGERVMLDADLAALYGVSTKRMNEQVRRNAARFPEDFMFQLTADESAALRSQIATSNTVAGPPSREVAPRTGRGGRRYLPYAFTEHGAVMAATVLNSQRAVEVSVFVVRAFVRMRRMLADQRQFALKLAEVESKLAAHDQSIKVVFDAIRQLMQKPKPYPEPPKQKIGFHVSELMAEYGVGGKRKKR
jgi:hypothetical protein